MTERLKPDQPKQRTIDFTIAELTSIRKNATAGMRTANTGSKRTSLRHVADLTSKALDRFRGIGAIPIAARLYQFKIALKETHPPIWRRIQVKYCTLDKLHERIQTAMGWTNSHLYRFKIDGMDYGDPSLLSGDPAFEFEDSTSKRLGEILPKTGERIRFDYEYDFGDSWFHEVVFEGCIRATKGCKYPLCVEGARACPPEDVGGIRGYGDYLEAIADPKHERHRQFKGWYGPFDPEAFDAAKATKRMKRGLPDWRSESESWLWCRRILRDKVGANPSEPIMRILSLIPVLILGSVVCAAEPKVHPDIAYAEPKNERQTLDVYSPTEVKDRPVIFWIHGGGWQAGDKKEVDLKPQAFVDKGFVFVSINYRLLDDKVTIQQMAGDLAKAFRWVHDHAKDYGGDPNSILVAGHSAGAQLAALISTDERYLKAEKLTLTAIKGCVPVDGDTYDVPLQIATVEERRATIYKRKFGTEESQKELSPVTHAAKGKSIPPFLILHVADHPETKGQSLKLVKALEDAGVSAKAYPAEGKTHTTINSELGKAADPATKAMFEFVERVLKPRTLDHFKANLDKSLTPTKAVERFGMPDRDIGSGLMIYEYALDDGSKILFGFPGEGPIVYAKHTPKDGKTVELPLKKFEIVYKELRRTNRFCDCSCCTARRAIVESRPRTTPASTGKTAQLPGGLPVGATN